MARGWESKAVESQVQEFESKENRAYKRQLTQAQVEIRRQRETVSYTHLSHIPILIVSGESSERYKSLCESIGAKGFFQKPVNIEALQKKLASLIVLSHEKSQPKPRVRLRVMLRLRGIDSTDTDFEIVTATENVSANGFLCGCSALVGLNTVLEVSLATDGARSAGKARVIQVDWPGTVGQRCDFEFLEKPIDWILQ